MSKRVFSKQFSTGEEIFRIGEIGCDAYIIESGKVDVWIPRGDKMVIIAELSKGEMFGEMSMIDNAPRSATVTASQDTEVVVIQRSRFQHPFEVGNPLMNMILRVLLNRFRDSQSRYSGQVGHTKEIDLALEETRKLALQHIEAERSMRNGIDNEEFEMHYQPIVSLEKGGIAGFEALMRWNKNGEGHVSPVEFIALAEETGLILELGRWSLKRAINNHLFFVDRFKILFPDHELPFMSVNVSGLQLSEMREIDELSNIIKQSGIDPILIKLEMTESLLVEDPDQAAEALRKLKECGISIAIDDFGTGYSSLSYLHQFPLDTLKIDREFVNNMDKSENSLRIVSSIAQLALSLDMNIVAEGIEEKAQMDSLRALGCQYGQGYFMAKPISFDATVELLETRPSW